MTDRELLELAAKAAGYCLSDGSQGYRIFRCKGGVEWNPLTDDGDALRLAVRLNLQIIIEDERCGCVTASWGDDYQSHAVEHSETPETACAATRRAIVRAAAEIARARI